MCAYISFLCIHKREMSRIDNACRQRPPHPRNQLNKSDMANHKSLQLPNVPQTPISLTRIFSGEISGRGPVQTRSPPVGAYVNQY